jgi:succinate dehydrogenase / fumarate reductase flavoprotein subunit
VLHERLPGISESARIFAGVDVTRQPIPIVPTAHYTMGGIPTNLHCEVTTRKNGGDDIVVRGLMAVGEATCVSVHGANRLGSNSLVDLMVFGRAAALRCAEKLQANATQPELPANATGRVLGRLDRFRHAAGGTSTARLRANMQPVMTANCEVFRNRRNPEQGVGLIDAVQAGAADIAITDRSLIWNSDLIETLEFDNLIRQAVATHALGRQSHREPRRARARGFSCAGRQDVNETHACLARRRRQSDDRLSTRARLPDVERHRVYRAEGAGLLGRAAGLRTPDRRGDCRSAGATRQAAMAIARAAP